MESFQVGDRVVAGVTTQGMKRGESFEVVEREERHILGNVYATLTLRAPDGREVNVVNGQLVLSRAS